MHTHTHTNAWMADVKGTIEHFKSWEKKMKPPAGIKNGVIEGVLYDSKGCEVIYMDIYMDIYNMDIHGYIYIYT